MPWELDTSQVGLMDMSGKIQSFTKHTRRKFTDEFERDTVIKRYVDVRYQVVRVFFLLPFSTASRL